jgi:hypothetical protein
MLEIRHAWSLVAWHFIWPALRERSRADALRPLLLLHSFRFLGLSFLVPGVVSPDLPSAFAVPAAYGDFAAMLLALISLAALRSSFGIALVWVFNIWGTADLLSAFVKGGLAGLEPSQLGAAFYIPIFIVPLLLVTHVLVFRILLRRATTNS